MNNNTIGKKMTNGQLNLILELIAQNIEAKATTAKEAAKMIRAVKIKKEKPVTQSTKQK